jgi:hypothetical protein
MLLRINKPRHENDYRNTICMASKMNWTDLCIHEQALIMEHYGFFYGVGTSTKHQSIRFYRAMDLSIISPLIQAEVYYHLPLTCICY